MGVWKAEPCHFVLQRHEGQSVVVLAQHRSEVFLDSTAKGYSLSSWECCSPQQLVEALAEALAEMCESPSSKSLLAEALRELLPDAPPLLRKEQQQRSQDRVPKPTQHLNTHSTA